MSEVSSTKRVLCGGKRITKQDIEEHYGKHRKEAAAIFNVSESTFWRKLRMLGILQWPYPKRKCNPEIAVLQSSRSSSQSNSEEKETHFEEEETTEMGDESKSISTLCIDNTFLEFDKSALTLEDLFHPENETSMKKALSIPSDNPSLFSKERAEQIDGLLVDFPDETENLVGKDHKDLLKDREKLDNQIKELTTQLMAVQKQQTEINEQMNEKSKQSKDFDIYGGEERGTFHDNNYGQVEKLIR